MVDAITITSPNKKLQAIGVDVVEQLYRPGTKCTGTDGVILLDEAYLKTNEKQCAIFRMSNELEWETDVPRFTRSMSEIRGHKPDYKRFIVTEADVKPIPARVLMINENLALLVNRYCAISNLDLGALALANKKGFQVHDVSNPDERMTVFAVFYHADDVLGKRCPLGAVLKDMVMKTLHPAKLPKDILTTGRKYYCQWRDSSEILMRLKRKLMGQHGGTHDDLQDSQTTQKRYNSGPIEWSDEDWNGEDSEYRTDTCDFDQIELEKAHEYDDLDWAMVRALPLCGSCNKCKWCVQLDVERCIHDSGMCPRCKKIADAARFRFNQNKLWNIDNSPVVGK